MDGHELLCCWLSDDRDRRQSLEVMTSSMFDFEAHDHEVDSSPSSFHLSTTTTDTTTTNTLLDRAHEAAAAGAGAMPASAPMAVPGTAAATGAGAADAAGATPASYTSLASSSWQESMLGSSLPDSPGPAAAGQRMFDQSHCVFDRTAAAHESDIEMYWSSMYVGRKEGAAGAQ